MKKLLKTLLILVLIFSFNTAFAVTILDDFNAYSNGDLHGQGSWSGDTRYDVQGSVVQEGAKAVESSATGTNFNIAKTLSQTYGSGIYGCYLRVTSTSDAKATCSFRGNSGADSAGTANLDTDAQARVTGGASSIELGAISANTWYLFEVDLNVDTDQIRARLNGGSWSSWVNLTTTTTGIDTIQLNNNFGGTTQTTYYDNFTYDAGGTAAGGEVLLMGMAF